jgi:hypothetical protein
MQNGNAHHDHYNIEKEIETLNSRTSLIPFINEWVGFNAQKTGPSIG